MTYLAIQNSYEDVQIALCTQHGILTRVNINKIHASAQCIPTLDTLISQHQRTLADISYIVAQCGPGPFTTLRVVLATVNGIQAASGIPVIGINALEALLQEYAHPTFAYTIALLHAFNQDVYYAVADSTGIIKTSGCQNSTLYITQLAATYPEQPLFFVGNGARMYQELIKQTFGTRAHFPQIIPETCSLEQVSRMGQAAWLQGRYQKTALSPEYIKTVCLSTQKSL